MKLTLLIFVSLSLLLFPNLIFARTTPEDIVNAKRGEYQKIVVKYSKDHQQKLAILSNNIASVNKKITDDLSTNMERQGQILDQYVSRHPNADVTNARYWLTFAHEAVAYQAAHIYSFNLRGESAIKSNALSLISNLQFDINILAGKVEKSRKIIAALVRN